MNHVCTDLAYCECVDPVVEQARLPHYREGPDAALRWISDIEQRAVGARVYAAADRRMPGRWLGILADYEWLIGKAWLYAHGDSAQARAAQADLRRRAGVLTAVESVLHHVRYRRRPSRSTGYPGAEWVEPHLAPVLDRMAVADGEAAAVGMLGELRHATAAAMGEQVAGVLDPFVPAAVVRS